ncbi:hypothetical protein NN561_011092 [Cricetulus griseus]
MRMEGPCPRRPQAPLVLKRRRFPVGVLSFPLPIACGDKRYADRAPQSKSIACLEIRKYPLSAVTRLPSGWGHWYAISSLFGVPSLRLRLLRVPAVRRSYQARLAGTALSVFAAWHCRCRSWALPSRASALSETLETLLVSGEFASGLASFLLPLLSLSTGTRSPRLALERPLGI